MTLQQINYALTISEYGSMNKAAEKLGISQPTLTSAMRELERETDFEIFLRTNKQPISDCCLFFRYNTYNSSSRPNSPNTR